MSRSPPSGTSSATSIGFFRKVANAAADEVRLVAHVAEPRDDADRVGIEPVDRDLRRVGRGRALGRIEREPRRRPVVAGIVEVFVGLGGGGVLRRRFVHAVAGSGGARGRGKSPLLVRAARPRRCSASCVFRTPAGVTVGLVLAAWLYRPRGAASNVGVLAGRRKEV